MTLDSQRQFIEAVETAKLTAMAEFSAGAGHEINNPLAIIAGRAQMLLREEKDDERRRALALISAQAMRVYEMIADMRLFAKPPKPELRTLDPEELVAQLIEEMLPLAAQQETVLCRTASVEQVSNLPTPAGQNANLPMRIEADRAQLMVALRRDQPDQAR